MVVVTRLDADAPTREAPDYLLVGDLDQHRRRDPASQVRELLVESVGLLGGAREAVEDEAVLRILLLEALGRHRHDQRVGNEVTGVHVLLRLLAELRALLDVGAQHVAGGDERQPEVVLKARRLRPLARARRTEQDQIELRHERPLYRGRLAWGQAEKLGRLPCRPTPDALLYAPIAPICCAPSAPTDTVPRAPPDCV